MRTLPLIAIPLLFGAQVLRAGPITYVTFEPSTYTAGSDIVGTDGWFRFGGGPGGVVTPDGGSNNTVLQGGQSFALTTTDASLGRPWNAGTVIHDGISFSALMQVASSPPGPYAVFGLMSNASAGFVNAQLAARSGNWQIAGNGGFSGAVPIVLNNKYLVEIVANFNSGTVDGYVTNLTAGGPRTFLATVTPNSNLSNPFTASYMAANGGFQLWNNNLVGVYDLLATPEPGAMSLLALAGIASLARRPRGR